MWHINVVIIQEEFIRPNKHTEHITISKFFNPFMPNVFSHPYQLDKSISNFRVVRWYFFIFIQISKKHL